MTANPEPAVGSSATYVATVTPSAAVAGGGTVGFLDTANAITDCGNLAVTSASCESLTYESVGSGDDVTATFSGNANWAGFERLDELQHRAGTTERHGHTLTIESDRWSTGDAHRGRLARRRQRIGRVLGYVHFGMRHRGARRRDDRALHDIGAKGRWQLDGHGDVLRRHELQQRRSSVKTVSVAAAPTTVTTGATNASPIAFSADTFTAMVNPIPDGGTVDFTDEHGTITGCGAVVDQPHNRHRNVLGERASRCRHLRRHGDIHRR